jgi:hypothetical protein
MRPHRPLMDPTTLEMLILLRFNRDLWDERDVDTLMVRTQSAAFVFDPSIPSTPASSTPMSASSATTTTSY